MTDSSGSVVPNAKVTLTNVNTGVQTTIVTSGGGEYEFLYVRLGQYTVRAEATGFKTATSDPFEVTVNAHQRVEMALQVGNASDLITVSGAAELLETDTSNRSQVISTRELVNLPLNGRSYADLTLLVPGVRRSGLLDFNNLASREGSYNVNGQRSQANNFILDGVDNNAYGTSNQGFANEVIQLAPDAVAEYRVETSNYSAEYGRAAGAVINAVTRSGTNKVHVTLWEFLRNTQLNAVGFFQPLGGVKPIFKQNQFGGAAGLPIIKDRLFFFADYEGTRRSQSQLAFATLPTLDQRNGILGTAIRNPLTGQVYTDGVVPLSARTQSSQNILNALPLPNLPGNANNFQSLPTGTIVDNKGDFRMDYFGGTRFSAFARYSQRIFDSFQPGAIPGPAGGNNNGDVHVFNQQIVPGLTYSFTPTTVLEARIGIGWTEGGKTPIGLGQPSLYGANFPGLPTDKRVAGALNSVNVGGFTSFGRQGSNPQFQNPFTVNPKISLSKFFGRHTLKVGYEYLDLKTTINDFNPQYGQFTYSGQFSNPTGAQLGGAASQPYTIADFLIGAPSQYELNNIAIVDYKQWMHFLYAQDDWKVNNRLTLNLGLRYEFASPQYVADNRLGNFDPKTGTLVPAKYGDLYDRSRVEPRLLNFAPRVGFAWRPIDKLVLRGGYGISYQQFNRLGGENLLAYNGPFIVDAVINQDPRNLPICTSPTQTPETCFRPTSFGYPDQFAVPARFSTTRSSSRYIPGDNPTASVQTWHLTIQRELLKNVILDVAYVGNRGNHLQILGDFNQAVTNQPGQNLSLAARRPYQDFGFIQIAYGAGYSTYNALQVKLEKRFSNGLFVLNSFTWSRAIDVSSGHLETGNGDNSRVNFRNLANDKGQSGYNQPLNDTLSVVWELPFGKGRRFGNDAPKVVNYLLGGWRMTNITTLTSGLPINITYNPTPQFQVSTAPNYRPNVIGNPVTPEGPRTVNTYLNRASFGLPTDPRSPWGSAGRNIARGYPFYQVDLGLHKSFALPFESSRVELRGEAFNLFNQTNFQTPDGNFSNSTFGRITSTFQPRQLQVSAKIYF